MMDKDKGNRPKREQIYVGMQEGLRADTFAESVGVSDTNNVVPLPDGSGFSNREGHAIYQTYNPQLSGTNANRIAMVMDSAPPNIEPGTWLLSLVDTSDNNAILGMELFKPRCNLPGDTTECDVFFSPAVYSGAYGSTFSVVVKRTGDIGRTCTVDYATRNETALAGTDYTATSGTLSFAANVASATISVVSTGGYHPTDRSLSVVLSNPTNGATVTVSSAQIDLEGLGAIYNPLMFDNNIANALKVISLNAVTNVAYLHELTVPTGAAAYRRQAMYRVGPDTVMIVFYDDTADPRPLKFALYSIATMVANGLGGASPTATAAYATVSYTYPGDAAWSQMRVFPYDATNFYIVNGTHIISVNLTTGASANVVIPDIVGMTRPYFCANNLGAASYQTLFGFGVDQDGHLVVNFTDGAGPWSVYGIIALNRTTGTVVRQKLILHGEDGYCEISSGCVRADGTVILYNTDAEKIDFISADLATLTELGAAKFYDFGFCPSDAAGKVIMYENDALQLPQRLTVGVGGYSVDYTFGLTTNTGDWQYHLDSNTVHLITDRFVAVCNNSDGVETSAQNLAALYANAMLPVEADAYYYLARNVWGTI